VALVPVTSEVAGSIPVAPAISARKPDGYEAIRFSVYAACGPDGSTDGFFFFESS
jgi:hypothetical protein